jgi:hypothetical protein
MSTDADNPAPSQRLALTRTFRDGRLNAWRNAQLFVIGAGNLGQRVALEAVLSGTRVTSYDPGTFGPENSETQWGTPGQPKVEHLACHAAAFAPGRLHPMPCDILHAGIGRLRQASLLIDCTDDPNLAVPLTRISNGLGIPLLRGALAGDGQLELGRVACSHGGGEHACQMCNYSLEDLSRPTRRQPCAGNATPTQPPTLAGGAIGMTIAGVVLLQAQRLITGNDLDQVLDREWIVDLTHGQILPLRRTRSSQCLSGHVRWSLIPLDRNATDTCLEDLFVEAARRWETDDTSDITLEPYGHPLCRDWTCVCGEYRKACGSRWQPDIACSRCGQPLTPQLATAYDWLTEAMARELDIAARPLAQLGIPRDGAMFVARAPKKKPLRFLLSMEDDASHSPGASAPATSERAIPCT